MNVLVTGAAGFMGRNLVLALKNLRDGKDRTRPNLTIDAIDEFDLGSTPEDLDAACARADFVFHLAGVNRPQDPAEFTAGNVDLTERLLSALRRQGSRAPVMLASSIQAFLTGRFAGSAYGLSKVAAEEAFFRYGEETGNDVLVYRFPNAFGKGCRPNYNSAVATFCHAAANDLPWTVNDRNTELELVYIDDLVAGMLDALEGKALRCDYAEEDEPGNPAIHTPLPRETGRYCYIPVTHRITLGEISDLLDTFRAQPTTLRMPEIVPGSFSWKLYSTYLSYLPPEKTAFPLTRKTDSRGSFTEILKTVSGGQFSVNVSLPGITKGQHWHHSKWEFFIVVSGRARIQERPVDGTEIRVFDVDGEHPTAVHMLPGFTHSITNLSSTEKLVTLMWANEPFDPDHPDTFYEEV